MTNLAKLKSVLSKNNAAIAWIIYFLRAITLIHKNGLSARRPSKDSGLPSKNICDQIRPCHSCGVLMPSRFMKFRENYEVDHRNLYKQTEPYGSCNVADVFL